MRVHDGSFLNFKCRGYLLTPPPEGAEGADGAETAVDRALLDPLTPFDPPNDEPKDSREDTEFDDGGLPR